MEQLEEVAVQALAEAVVGLLPEVGVDTQVVGYGGILALSDLGIDSLAALDVGSQQIDLDVKAGSHFTQEFTELL